MRIEIAACSYRGGRASNEDSVKYVDRNGICAVAVADGLGGHGGGRIASMAVVDEITRAFMQNPQITTDAVKTIFEQANLAVVNAQTPAQKMKSTGVALFVKDGAAIWAHVGDSRLYHFKNGALHAFTLDHSASQLAVYTGEITRDEIRHHIDRSRVLRAFGTEEGFKAEIAPVYLLEPGFHAFLLCTDGYWENVIEDEMEAELEKAITPKGWLAGLTRRVDARAPHNQDNYTAAAVFIER